MLYAATSLKENGFEVAVLDCFKENLSLSAALKQPADAYVFYSVFLSRESDLLAAEIAEKTKGKDTPIIFIGPDPTYYPGLYLTASNRMVVRGEPEETLLELVKNFPQGLKNISGLSWFCDGKIMDNPARHYLEDLDSLPFPDRRLYAKFQEYNNAKFSQLPSTVILTSRGCTFRCYYCVPNSLSYARELEWKQYHKEKPAVVKRSAQNVIQEFQEISRLGFRAVSVLDDQFLWERERTEEILRGIKDLHLEISILARPDLITDIELGRLMAAAGIRHVALGVESFSQPILDYIGKDLKVESVEKAVDILKSCAIQPEINILLGSCPLETMQTIEDTFRKVEAMDIDIVHAQVCAPFPGTEFYFKAKENQWMVTDEYVPIDPAVDALIAYPHLSREELISCIRQIHRRHYFKPTYLFKKLVSVRSLLDFKEKIKTGQRMWQKFISFI